VKRKWKAFNSSQNKKKNKSSLPVSFGSLFSRYDFFALISSGFFFHPSRNNCARHFYLDDNNIIHAHELYRIFIYCVYTFICTLAESVPISVVEFTFSQIKRTLSILLSYHGNKVLWCVYVYTSELSAATRTFVVKHKSSGRVHKIECRLTRRRFTAVYY